MRPLKLIVTGFGTYCNRTEIDLDKLGTKGLYLITGDTGSGKTTIFDAITYALYGDLNGQNRSIGMIRSTFATPDIPTEVDLTFEYRGKIYNVRRNPEYQRTAKRGEGLTTQIAEAVLTMPDGSVVTQQSKVTAAIVDLLRINKEQFSQIVMIAQGDFQKLLVEGTDKRMEIFRNLFKTDYYLKLQNKLADEEKNLAVECKNIRSEMGIYIKSVQCDAENPSIMKLEKAQNGELTFEETMNVISQIVDEDKSTEKELEQKLAAIEKDLLNNAEVMGLVKSMEKIEGELELKNKMLAAGIEESKVLKEEFEKQKEKIKEREAKEKEYAVLSQELENYDELDGKIKKVCDAESEISIKESDLGKGTEKVEKLENEQKTLLEELKTLASGDVKIVTLQNEQEKLQKRDEALNHLEEYLIDLEKAASEYNKAIAEYKEASEKSEELETYYRHIRKAFMDEQAGILAEELEENKPCPVCGSLTHPRPAKKSVEAPNEAALNEAEKAAAMAAKVTEEKNNFCVEKKTSVNEKTEVLKVNWENLFCEKIEAPEYKLLSENLRAEKTRIGAELDNLKKELAAEEKKISRKEKIEQRLPQMEVEIANEKKVLNQLSLDIAGLNSTIEADRDLILQLKSKLKYDSKNAAETALLNMEKFITSQKKALETAEQNYSENDKKNAVLKGELKALEKRLQEISVVDADSVKNKENELKAQKAAISEKVQDVNSRIDRNTDAVKKLEKSSGNLVEKENRFTWVSSLSKTANGNLSSGKEKIKLETYIQMNYFDRIIAHANKRLMIMSDGQYELIRKKEADNLKSQTGLELDVIDHYNGGQRSVKSLSGGESFEASLALALGLSDEVRMSAGGIQLDSMFVDEGFGTLDSETLQKAFKALSSITDGNRIVGIISHVDLLKEKIDRQIVVKKERTGGSTVQINV